MSIEIKEFIQDEFIESKEWETVSKIAQSFNEYLSKPEITKEIDSINKPNAKSQEIEKVILPKAEELGFTFQKKGLFAKYASSRLQPDFFKSLDETGIIIEVERGQTTQNNNALKDLWKCHICQEAHYLFLFVPNVLKQNDRGKIQGRPFSETEKDLSSFFRKENYTNVRGLVIFGY